MADNVEGVEREHNSSHYITPRNTTHRTTLLHGTQPF